MSKCGYSRTLALKEEIGFNPKSSEIIGMGSSLLYITNSPDSYSEPDKALSETLGEESKHWLLGDTEDESLRYDRGRVDGMP